MDESSSGDEESNGSIPTPIVPSFRLATLNITDGRKSRLNAAIRCMEQANVDVGLLTETKLSNDMYTKSAMGYTVSATKAVGMSGGVALVHRQGKGWGLESIRSFGPNVIRATLVSGQRRWYIIGGYISPNEQDGSTLACIQQAWDSCRNLRWPVITLGDFNVDLGNPQGTNQDGLERRLETAALMDTMGMSSMRERYRQCKKRMGKYWTWSQCRLGEWIGSICDHINTDQPQFFLNCQIKMPRMDTDHWMLIAVLRLGSVKNHQRYVRSRTKYPIKPVSILEGNRADGLLEELAAAAARREKEENGRNASWITQATWALIHRKAAAQKAGNGGLLRTLKMSVCRALNADRKARAQSAAAAAQSHLEKGEIRKAFGSIKGWYRDAGPKPSKPSKEDIEVTRAEYVDLYTPRVPTEGLIPLHIAPYLVNDAPPTEEEVMHAVQKLSNNKVAGASGITAEILKDWMKEPGRQRKVGCLNPRRWFFGSK